MAAQIFLKLGEVGAESGMFGQELLKEVTFFFFFLKSKLVVKFSLVSDLSSWKFVHLWPKPAHWIYLVLVSKLKRHGLKSN